LIFIIGITEDMTSSIRLFTDDTRLYICVDKPNHVAEVLNNGINRIYAWSRKWFITFNLDQT